MRQSDEKIPIRVKSSGLQVVFDGQRDLVLNWEASLEFGEVDEDVVVSIKAEIIDLKDVRVGPSNGQHVIAGD